jgi:hypothetical protein
VAGRTQPEMVGCSLHLVEGSPLVYDGRRILGGVHNAALTGAASLTPRLRLPGHHTAQQCSGWVLLPLHNIASQQLHWQSILLLRTSLLPRIYLCAAPLPLQLI